MKHIVTPKMTAALLSAASGVHALEIPAFICDTKNHEWGRNTLFIKSPANAKAKSGLRGLRMLFAVFLVFSTNAHAQGAYLVTNATVTNVTSVAGTTPNFAIKAQDGTGVCDNQYIIFPESSAPNANAHQRAFSLALTAMATGKKVTVYNYTDNSCALASYIEIIK